MAGKQLKRRIQSAKNISQITGAMESVAASKMKKAQLLASGGQPYQEVLRSIATQLRRSVGGSDHVHPLLTSTQEQAVMPSLYILVSSDKGLCGALNSNLFREAERTIPSGAPVIAIGKKAVHYCQQTDWEMLGVIGTLGDRPAYTDTKPASVIALQEFLSRRVSSVTLIYQKFHNTLIQRPSVDVLLPIRVENLEEQMRVFNLSYTFEPGRDELLEDLLPYYVHMSLYQSVLSAKAAEQSARMIAMKNASENADEVGESLQLLYNQERQKLITSEISDVVTAGLALEG